MAPEAKIVLAEAASNSCSDLLQAVSVASRIVQAAGGGEVSMSGGGSVFNGETSYDSYFQSSGVVYFASTGDNPGTEFPSVSPNIVAVGGAIGRAPPISSIPARAWGAPRGLWPVAREKN